MQLVSIILEIQGLTFDATILDSYPQLFADFVNTTVDITRPMTNEYLNDISIIGPKFWAGQRKQKTYTKERKIMFANRQKIK